MKSLNTHKYSTVAIFSLFLSFSVSALVEYDQNVTPEVIFGSGNSNGSFTTDRRNGVELGLRAKIPFVGTTNSNGDGSYSFTLDETDHDNDSGTDRRWNFEFSVNTNYNGSSGNNIDQYTYEIGVDGDPGDGTDFLVFDPITPTMTQPFYDHSIGDNATANGLGAEATDSASYLNLISSNNLLQQSWRHAFFPFSPLDTYNPNSPGTYDVYMVVRLAGIEVARTDIKVIINDHLVTPDVIFGTGNANGNFTLSRNDNVEVGLRAKIPFSGLTNYDGDYTYSYTIAETYQGDAGNPNRWNFDFSVNVDYSDETSSGANLDEFTYEMGLDSDPSSGTNFIVFDPTETFTVAIFDVAPDHSIGDNATANGGGAEYGGLNVNAYNAALASNNVLQNSQFYTSAIPNAYDSSIPGNYRIYFLVKDSQGAVIARTEIQVLIEGAAPSNSPPVVVADSYVVDEDNSLIADDADGTVDVNVNNDGVLANDSDSDIGDTLNVTPVGVIAANVMGGGNIVMATDGTFTYTSPADFNGVATFDYNVEDGTNSVASSLTIMVNSVNDTPSFVKGSNQTVNEDSPSQTVSNWATSISKGAANESAQVLTFDISNNNNSLFNAQPVVDEATGDLTYTPAANAHGLATVTVNLSDNGGGLNTSVDQTFTITVISVNDAPEFDIQGDKIYYSLQNNQVQITNYTSNTVLEPNGEMGQSIAEYAVTIDSDTQDILNDTDGVIVDVNGTLTLDFNINNFGTAIISVILKDDGASVNPDVNASVARIFNVSHLKDAMFSDGFEDIVVIKVFEFIEKSYDNPLFDRLSIEDLPWYDDQTDSVVFLGHRLQLKGDYQSLQSTMILQQWISEVLNLEMYSTDLME